MNVLLLLIIVFLLPLPAFALDYFVEGGAGLTLFQRTAPDGTWVQEGFPHRWEMTDRAFRAGAGVRVNEQWSLGLNYLDLGTVGVSTKYVADESYDPYAHRCLRDCERAKDLYTTDTLRGGELIGTYTPWQWPFAPFVRGGVAVLSHALNWETLGKDFDLHGLVVMGAAGGGLCYHGWACADITYYKGIGSTKFPVSTEAVVPMVSLRYAF